MKKSMSLVTVMLVWAAGAAWAQDQPAAEPEREAPEFESGFQHVQIKVNLWSADYAGTIKYEDVDVMGGTATIVGQKLDLVDELGLENPQSIPEIEARIKLGEKHLLTLAWYGVDYGGEETLDTPIEFAGYEFMAHTDFESTFRIDRFKLTHTWSPFMGDAGSLGFFWGGEYFLWTVGYKGIETTTGATIDKSQTMPLIIPVVGIAGNLNLPYGFGLFATYGGMGVAYEDIEASYTDLEAGLTWDLKWFHVGAGYRSLSSHLNFEDQEEAVEFDIDHQGWLISIGANF